MVFTLQLSRTAQKALDKLPPNAVKKIYHHLEEVARDPYRPRPKADTGIARVRGAEHSPVCQFRNPFCGSQYINHN
jgi:mRNA-degrading endonuclease RelE of RelBE toxin-antitoxin system